MPFRQTKSRSTEAWQDGVESIALARSHTTSVAEEVYAAIREAIISGALPPGARLSEEWLAKRLSVSRTPVREAIMRLETEKLAARGFRRGLVVRDVGRDEILELYVVRQTIDGLSVRLAAEAARRQDVLQLHSLNAELSKAASSGDWKSMAEINLQFHEALCQAGGNRVLLEIVRMVNDRVRRFPDSTFSQNGRATEALAEHAAIIEAIERHDAASAEQLARDHMGKAMAVRMTMLFQPASASPPLVP